MPKTNVAYGNTYKPCPCAQINDYTTSNNTYFTSVCHSPKRKPCKITEANQVRICMGGTSRGKRYTSCPYYVKNANVNVPKRTRSNSSGNLLSHIIGAVVCMFIAKSCLSSGVEYSGMLAILFFVIGLGCIITLFKTNEKVGNGKGGRKRR